MPFGRVVIFCAFGIAIILNCCDRSEAYKILCPYPTISRSHFIVVEALMRGLALAGHNVTVASSFPPSKEIPNYRFVKNKMGDSKILEALMDKPGDTLNMFRIIPAILDFVELETRQLLRITMGESLLGLSAHFKCPSVLFSSLPATNPQLRLMGNPMSTSYVSSPVMALQDAMDFLGRLLSFMYLLFETPILYYWELRTGNTYNVHFRQPNFPTFNEMRNNVSAIFVNDHMSQGRVRPLVPGIIEIGGIQVSNEQTQLDDDLRNWMDASEYGVIYCSFGSNVRASDLDPHIQKQIFQVFANLKENVLMKYETDIVDLPNNIRVGKWLPQVGILQHKKCKLFITHAGLGGITEARYFGVPLITVLTFADQIFNSKNAVLQNWAVEIKFTELKGETLSNALNQILDNPRYTNTAKHISNLYHDRPQSSLETAIFWVEYIIRHKGAAHLRSNAVHLNFVQYHSLDVIALLLVVLLLITIINIKILKCICRMCCGRLNKVKNE